MEKILTENNYFLYATNSEYKLMLASLFDEIGTYVLTIR